MEVMHFHCLLKNEDMEDIVEVLDDEKVDELMEYIIGKLKTAFAFS